MSGSIGAHRINRGDVQPTLDDYIDKVLKPFPGYQDCAITGSYNAGTKKDHGDIDLVVYIDAKDIKKLKKDFKAYLDKLPDDITIPFALGKRKGDKAQMFGAIVTCGFPIHGTNDPVQIDNILVTTRKDATFQRSFLNLNAQKQALFQGLVRVLLNETNNPIQIMSHFGLEDLPDTGPGQEYEFVLSTSGLSLRLVNLTGDFKEISRTEVWRSNDWSDVEWLLSDYDMDDDYENILSMVAKKIRNDRSRRRIFGIMKSMIRVGPGEIGTPKGEAKEAGIRLAKEALNITEGMKSLLSYMKTYSMNESLVSTMTIGPIIAFIIGVGTFGEFNDFRGTYNIMDIIRQWWSDNKASEVIRGLMDDPDIDKLKSEPKYMQNKQLFAILAEKLAQPTLNMLARLAGNKIKAEI